MSTYGETRYLKLVFTNWDSLVLLVLLPFVYVAGRFMFRTYYRFVIPDFKVYEALVERDNKAVAVAFAGFETAIGLVTWGALAGLTDSRPEQNLWQGIVWVLFGMLFLVAAVVINDKVYWGGRKVVACIDDGNIAAGVATGGSYVAAGMVALYTCGGGGPRFDENVASAFLFFALCQIEFLALLFIMEFGFRGYVGNLRDSVMEGNIAIGVLVGGCNVAMAIVATNPLKKGEELVAFFVWFALVLVAFFIFALFSRFVLLYKLPVQDEIKRNNWGLTGVIVAALLLFSVACLSFLSGSCSYTLAVSVRLRERLISTSQYQEIFRWANALRIGGILFYVFVAKLIFAIPHIAMQRRSHVQSASAAVNDDAKSAGEEVYHRTFFESLHLYLQVPERYNQRKKRQMEEGSGIFREMASRQGSDIAESSTMLTRQMSIGSVAPKTMPPPDMSSVAKTRAVAFMGYLVSIGIMIRAAFVITNSPAQSNWEIVQYSCYWLALGIVLQHIGYYLQRFLLWGRFPPASEHNLAASIIDAAVYVTVGLQVGSNLVKNSEPGPFNIASDTSSALIFFGCQLVLVAAAGYVHRLATKFDDVQCLADGNVAAAICNGSTMIATGVLASVPPARTDEILTLVTFFCVALLVLELMRFTVLNKLIMVSQDLDKEIMTDHNWGAALTEGAIMITMAYCLTAFLREICQTSGIPTVGNSTVVPTPSP